MIRKELAMLTDRQKEIIMILKDKNDFITFLDIANELKVSAKTIRNDIGYLKKYFSEKEYGTIITKPHAGVLLEKEEEKWERYEYEGMASSERVTPYLEIQPYIIYHLLTKGCVTTAEIENALYVSRSAIERNLPLVQQFFDKNRILLKKQKGKGYCIEATTYNWRLAMWIFFNKYKDSFEELQVRTTYYLGIAEKDIAAISAMLKGFDPHFMIEILQQVEIEFGFTFSYVANMRAAFLLSIMLIQVRRKEYIEIPKTHSCKTDSNYNDAIADMIISRLEREYHVSLPKSEREWVKIVVGITEIQEFNNHTKKLECQLAYNELCRVTLKIIHLMSEISNSNLAKDEFLSEHLFLELKAMVERLKYKINFGNPLLKQIKVKYSIINAMAWSISVLLDRELKLEVNEDEVGFLALHLGGAIERSTRNVKACVVCNYGIGISQILREKLVRNIADIEITEVLSIRDINRIRNSDCDFIISTIRLDDEKLNKEVVLVEHLLLPSDINNIEFKMREIRRQKLENNDKLKIDFKKQLFREDLLYIGLEANNKKEVLEFMCNQLEGYGYVTLHFKESVFEREEQTSTEIGKRFALPHGYSEDVICPIVSVALLKHPIVWTDEALVDTVILLAIDLDESLGMKEAIIKFYKDFSLLLEDDEGIKKMRTSKNTAELIQFFNNYKE